MTLRITIALPAVPTGHKLRRAFLCGVDHYTGNDYEHRRQWLEAKLHSTAAGFAIKLCAYAVMSNHYHVVLHVRVDLAKDWTDRDVVTRWHSLFSGNLLSQRFLLGETLSDIQKKLLSKDIETWRNRLCDISWYMRIVNEAIARKANAEDSCTGRFSVPAPALLYLLHPCSRGRVDSRVKRSLTIKLCSPVWPMLISTL